MKSTQKIISDATADVIASILPVLVIDFANQNTKVGTVEPDGHQTILKDESGNDTHPTAVYRKGDELLFGSTALAAGESDPKHLIIGLKADLSDPIKHEAAVLFIKDIKRQAETALGQPIRMVAVSWPSASTDEYRRTLHAVMAEAGLEVVPEGLGGMGSLPETACPAIAYADEKSLGQDVVEVRLVINAGHGTTDAGVVRFTADEIRLLTDGGDTKLGGRDIDSAFEEFVISKGISKGLFKAKDWQQIKEKVPQQAFSMRQRVEDAKKALSFRKDFPIHIPFGTTGKLMVTRDELIEHVLAPFAERMKPVVLRALADAARLLQPGESVSSAILSGGTFRIPYLQEKVGEWTGLPVRRDVDPQFAGVRGLGLHAHRLLKRRRVGGLMSPEDIAPRVALVTPFDLGVMVAMDADRPVESMLSMVLIGRNVEIPNSIVKKLSLLRDNQAGVQFILVQCVGQQPLEKCATLGTMEMTGLPPGPRADRLQIEVVYNAAGLVRVEAIEVLSGKRCVVELNVMGGNKLAA